ncbi:hypothetical protein Mgra_00001699, partial [Meloidogyne graminicola]
DVHIFQKAREVYADQKYLKAKNLKNFSYGTKLAKNPPMVHTHKEEPFKKN